MIKIIFLRNTSAFLPEIDAYVKYFNSTSDFIAYDSSKLTEFKIEDFDVIWEFKGLGGAKVKDRILIHEYASLSTGKFPKVKNYIKARMNPKPNLRIFLNSNVRDGFSFNDNIDFCYRDMGIDEIFLQKKEVSKEYHFVYVGEICKERELDKFLNVFTAKNNGKLCLVGSVDDEIYKDYKHNDNLIFTGKVSYSEVPQIAAKAKYGINFIPNKYPFNIQTSTKLLEYLALGLKVVTIDYEWIRQFEKIHNCSFYKLDYNNLRFDIDSLEKHEFITHFKPEDYLWKSMIDKAGIAKKLVEKYK